MTPSSRTRGPDHTSDHHRTRFAAIPRQGHCALCTRKLARYGDRRGQSSHSGCEPSCAGAWLASARIAHFPIRSIEQFVSKVVTTRLAWLSRGDYRPSLGHHVAIFYEQLRDHPDILPRHLLDAAFTYLDAYVGPHSKSYQHKLLRDPVQRRGGPLRFLDLAKVSALPRILASLPIGSRESSAKRIPSCNLKCVVQMDPLLRRYARWQRVRTRCGASSRDGLLSRIQSKRWSPRSFMLCSRLAVPSISRKTNQSPTARISISGLTCCRSRGYRRCHGARSSTISNRSRISRPGLSDRYTAPAFELTAWDYSRRNLDAIASIADRRRLHLVPIGYMPQFNSNSAGAD